MKYVEAVSVAAAHLARHLHGASTSSHIIPTAMMGSGCRHPPVGGQEPRPGEVMQGVSSGALLQGLSPCS